MTMMQQIQPAATGDYDSTEIAHRIVDVASDRKATDVHLMDIHDLTTFADYFVIMSGTSTVQIRALVRNIDEALDREGLHPINIEGNADDGWMLLDYGAIVVHVFSPDQREYYGLERLWREATTVVRIQ
jgi:ribosome-associated protein